MSLACRRPFVAEMIHPVMPVAFASNSLPSPLVAIAALPASSARAPIMLYRNNGLDSTSHVEISGHPHPAWLDLSNEIIEDAVDNSLVKNPFVPKAPEVELQALEFYTQRVGNVCDRDGRKIGRAPREQCKLGGITLHTAQRTQ